MLKFEEMWPSFRAADRDLGRDPVVTEGGEIIGWHRYAKKKNPLNPVSGDP